MHIIRAMRQGYKYLIFGLSILSCILYLSACVGKSTELATTDKQIVFNKNGIILSIDKDSKPSSAQVKINEQEMLLPCTYDGKKSILFPVQWQQWANYQIQVNGVYWQGIAPQKPQPYLFATADIGTLEELPILNEWSVVINESVAVSADGSYVAVGSFDRSLYLYEKTGKKIWEYRLQNGTPVSVNFSADASILYVGESSADGVLYAFDTLTGKIIWQYAFAADIGSSISAQWSNRPNVRSVTVCGDVVLAAGQNRKRAVEKQGERSIISYPTKSIIKAFDSKTGEVRWQYPASGTMDTGVSRIVTSADGGKVVFANQSWSPAENYPDGVIRVLNGETGVMAAWYKASVTKPYFSWVGIHDGIDMSPNGKYLTVFATDDQAVLFDLSTVDMAAVNQQLNPLWVKKISNVQDVGGVPIYTSGNAAEVTNEGNLYLVTSLTYVADKTTASSPPLDHPDASTIFAYDKEGELLWKWKTEGGMGKVRFSADSRFLIAALFHNYVTGNNDRAGVYCFDLASGQKDCFAWFYPVAGVAAVADIASDGSTIAVCEVPIRRVEGTLLGEHLLHIMQ